MSSPEEETFEEFLEKHNKIVEDIRNGKPVVNTQIEPEFDHIFGIVNPLEKNGRSLAPDDGTRADRFSDAEEFINQQPERQQLAPSKRGQKRGFVNPPTEHNNQLVPNTSSDQPGNYRFLERNLGLGSPTFQRPKISKRSERLAYLEPQVGLGRLGANGLAKGLVRSPTPGETEWWSQDLNAWIPAIYHEDLRPSLLAEASQLGKYEHPRAKGNDQFDETSFLWDQQYWAPDRESGWYRIKDQILFRFQRDGYPVPQGEVELWYYHGRVVLDMDNHPVKKYASIPACCSSNMEGWLMEAISRLNGRITQADFRARMPSTRTTNTGGIKPLFALTALGMRINRFRDEYSCPAWNTRTGGEKIKEWFWNRMSQRDRDMRMTYGLRKLTELELVELRALNKGTRPERAGGSALTGGECSKRSAEAEKKLQLKYGEQATDVLTGSKRTRYEAAVPGLRDCQPTAAAKRVKIPNHFPNNEEIHRYQWNPDEVLYGQPYNFRQDVSSGKRKHVDTDEKTDGEEPTESNKRQRSSYLHQRPPSGFHVNNATTTEQGSLSRERIYNILRGNLNPSSQSRVRRLGEYGQPGTQKGKPTLESLPPVCGTTPMESNPQYPTQYSSPGRFTAETHGPQLYPSSRYKQSHSAQGNRGRRLYKRTADAYGRPSESTEQPISDIQGSYVDSYGLIDDLSLPAHTCEVPHPISKQRAPTSKRKRDEVVEESDSGEDITSKSNAKRQKLTTSGRSSDKATYLQPVKCKQSIGLKIRTRVSSAGDASNNVNPASQPSSDADPQKLRNVRDGFAFSDEVEVINTRPVSVQKPLADQSEKTTPQDYAIKNADPLPSGAVDFRFVEPILESERKSVALALGYTRSEYISFMNEEPPQTSTGESYATQHAEIQAALAARWIAPEPVPQLVRLGAWNTSFAHFPFPDIELSGDQQEEFAQICKETMLEFVDPAHQTVEETLQISLDQKQHPISEEEPDSLFEADTLVADPQDELEPDKGGDVETDLGPLDRLNCGNVPISDGSKLPVIDDGTDSFNSLFDEGTLVADPEVEPKPKEGEGERSSCPQVAIGNQDELDPLFEDDTLIADPEDKPSQEGPYEKSDINLLDSSTGQADELARLFPELDGLTTQFSYEELMGVELPSLTDEEVPALDPL